MTASRDLTDPLFFSEIEERMTGMLTQLGMTVNPNPRFWISQPEAQSDIPSRLLDLLVVDKETGLTGVLEIDGESYHRDRKAQDHDRDQVLRAGGVRFIYRVSASRCYHDPYGTAEAFISAMRAFWTETIKAMAAAA